MELKIPESLELEHIELHEQLLNGIKEGGTIGEAAKAVADVFVIILKRKKGMHYPVKGC